MPTTARRRALVLAALAGLPTLLAASPAAAAPGRSTPVRASSSACVAPSGDLEFGGSSVRLDLRPGWLPAGEFLVVVPVDPRTGLDAGPRTTIDRGQRRATVVVPASGSELTPAVSIALQLGGDVVQRVPVAAGCGVLDPDPAMAPGIGAISTTSSTVTVPVTNRNRYDDDVLVVLWPVGGNTGEQTFVHLAPGSSGSVTFSGVAAGRYTVEASGATEFATATSAPFSVG